MNEKQFDILASCLSPVVSDADDQVYMLVWLLIFAWKTLRGPVSFSLHSLVIRVKIYANCPEINCNFNVYFL